MKRAVIAALCLLVSACGGSDSTVTSPATTTPAPPTTATLTGTVSDSSGPLAAAVVTALDGVNLGRSATTNSVGIYQLPNMTIGNDNFIAHAAGHIDGISGAFVSGAAGLNFTLPVAPLFSASGVGNTVFSMPNYVAKIHIIGTFTGFCCSNFVVNIGGRLVVNDVIGPLETRTVSDGIYQTTGGTVAITISDGVTWSFTEVR